MFLCFEKYSSVINLDLFWKRLFSDTGAQQKSLNDAPYTSLKRDNTQTKICYQEVISKVTQKVNTTNCIAKPTNSPPSAAKRPN
jgi:hypothetical protein